MLIYDLPERGGGFVGGDDAAGEEPVAEGIPRGTRLSLR
jgi:hypothetical protein